MSKPKGYVRCTECKGASDKVYSKEQVEKAYPNDIRTQILMKREYLCSICGHVFQVSLKEIARAFAEKRKTEGKSNRDVVNELTNFTKQQIAKEEAKQLSKEETVTSTIKQMREDIDDKSKRGKDEN